MCSRCGRCHRSTSNQGGEVGVGLGVHVEVSLDVGAQLNHSSNSVGLRGIGCHIARECGDIAVRWESQIQGRRGGVGERCYVRSEGVDLQGCGISLIGNGGNRESEKLGNGDLGHANTLHG